MRSEPFGGCAVNYLYYLTNTIKPYIDTNYKTKPEPENTALIGYSLGGLTALYALYTSKSFGKIGSLSGSLWYEGWTEFIDSHSPINSDAKVYLSLGKAEGCNRNQRLARVGDCTLKASEIIAKQLNSTERLTLEWNDGGHLTEIPHRFEKAILWLMEL